MPRPAPRCTDAGCECDHGRADHKRGGGSCKGLDSYGQPCACPSYQHNRDCVWCGGTLS